MRVSVRVTSPVTKQHRKVFNINDVARFIETRLSRAARSGRICLELKGLSWRPDKKVFTISHLSGVEQRRGDPTLIRINGIPVNEFKTENDAMEKGILEPLASEIAKEFPQAKVTILAKHNPGGVLYGEYSIRVEAAS